MNRLFSALLLSALSSVFFSPTAIANRPAAVTKDETDSQTQGLSSVDIMMMQQRQQTGDVVMLPPTEIQPGETVRIKLLDFPRRGMSMDKVKHEFGQPIATSNSVGKPPITSWTYDDRVVYFEYSTVIHVVAR